MRQVKRGHYHRTALGVAWHDNCRFSELPLRDVDPADCNFPHEVAVGLYFDSRLIRTHASKPRTPESQAARKAAGDQRKHLCCPAFGLLRTP